MQEAAEKTHSMLEPMYTTVDPTLPTFHSLPFNQQEDDYDFWERLKHKICKPFDGANEAKSFLKTENRERAMNKTSFLPAERTSMVTENEILNT